MKPRPALRQSVRALVALGLLAAVGSAEAAYVSQYDNRQNVNLLNSYAVTITPTVASGVSPGNQLRGSYGSFGDWWQNGNAPGNPPENLQSTGWTINFGDVRNVQTVLGFSSFLPYMFTNALLQSSTDGVIWSSFLPASVNYNGSGTTTATLNSPINTQWLRVTATNFASEGSAGFINATRMDALRVYGAPGTMSLDPKLDLISASAFSAPNAVQMSQNAGACYNPAANFVDDQPAGAMALQLLYLMGSTPGTSVNFTFTNLNQNIRFGKFGFEMSHVGGNFDNNMHFQVWGSTDGVAFTSLLLDQTGGYPAGGGFNVFNLPTFDGQALQFKIVSTSVSDLRFSDFFIFEDVPEPSTLALLGLGFGVIRRFRRLGRDRIGRP